MPISPAITFIFTIFKHHRTTLYSVIFFSALINLLILSPSIYMLQVYDRVLPSRNEMTLLMLTIMILGALGAVALLEYCRSMIAVNISKKIDRSLSQAVYQAAFAANMQQKNKNAENYLSDVTTVRQFFTGNAIFSFIDAPWFPVFILVIFLFNPWLGLFSLVGALLLIALAAINHKIIQQPMKEAGKMSHLSGNTAGITFRYTSTIAAMGLLPNFQRRWWALHEKFIQLQHQASEYNGRLTSITRFVRMALQSLILGAGGWLALDGQLTPGMMIAGSILLGRALAPIEQLIAAWKQWGNTWNALTRLEALLSQHTPDAEKMQLPAPEGNVSVENLTLASLHNSEVNVLHEISFRLAAGDIVGIIGPSASGKSTLARLLLGLQLPTRGAIRLDGADIQQWNREQLGPSLGYLAQEVEIFPGTIAENIARFNDVDTEKTIEAAKLAGVHEMILRLPAGYDTPTGIGLSGGQKQRIALARALYGYPKLLILDEPDASLDDMGLLALAQALAAMKKRNTTVVLITHRKQLLALTNKVLVLQGGKVKEFGDTPAVLNKLISSSTVKNKTAHASAQQA
ncbi:type I secretion system permease/ATPase [Mixta intestinalis]|uniref:ABC-type xenobiotic transporter n=1 Tax=Mixta intestinalis TaxID=1615494 RepID=A0A6P1Q4Q7_9GAMM|nr:type I secretion system permease/ATPase [Mixta intestinalis]QHM72918.1 Type I secretion system ATP-binding protein PrsD [Mixta intestinalis]